MVWLRVLASSIVGAVFILSGFLKLIDPIGTSLIMTEYFKVFGVDFLRSLSVPSGIVISMLEFSLGISLMLRIRLKELSWVLLAFVSFFTLLTFYLAVFEPINDCGCFGEAIKLTNYQTFYKNLVLLVLAVFIFLQKNNYRILTSRLMEWGIVFLSALAGLLLAIYSLVYLPPVDFTVFCPGTYIEDVISGGDDVEYMTRFVYEKDGRREEFGMENLPDSTWTYVESITETVGEGGNAGFMPLPVTAEDGTDLSSYIWEDTGRAFVSVIYNPSISERKISKIADMSRYFARTGGVRHFVLCSTDLSFAESLYGKGVISPVYRSDYKSLITFCRSNGGTVFMDSGEIIKKWSSNAGLSEKYMDEILKKDPKELAVSEEIWDNLFWEILLLAAVVALAVGNILLRKYNVKKHILPVSNSDGEGNCGHDSVA